MRVVVISHGHPDFARGGGEVAAYNLYTGINQLEDHDAFFIARAPLTLLHPGTYLALHREREYLIAGEAEVQNFTATVELRPDAEFAKLLKQLEPDVIHFHHYYYVGIELIRVAKKACPNARLVMTFHEYMAICTNHGTMVKTDMRLCYKATPRDCHACFPDKSPDWFFLRERYVKSFLALIDLYISPSEFLAQRYVDWGLPREKFRVIENGITAGEKLPPRPLAKGEKRTRFAFFGQMHPYKGLDLVIEAFAALPRKLRSEVRLDVHGQGLEQMQGPYPDKLRELMKQNRAFVHYQGPYEQHELPKLMAVTDWVVMGSIWWENSPLVIQEAWKFGRPVICPDFGGFSEKIRGESDGLRYRARDSAALNEIIERIVTDGKSAKFSSLHMHLPLFTSIERTTARHVVAYTS